MFGPRSARAVAASMLPRFLRRVRMGIETPELRMLSRSFRSAGWPDAVDPYRSPILSFLRAYFAESVTSGRPCASVKLTSAVPRSSPVWRSADQAAVRRLAVGSPPVWR